jgi:hypothetical protein
MKVRSSTRATSLGSERAFRKLFGRFSSFSRMKVPASTILFLAQLLGRIPPGNRRTTRTGAALIIP